MGQGEDEAGGDCSRVNLSAGINCEIRFVSAFEPGISLYRDLGMYLPTQGWEIQYVLSTAKYRSTRKPLESVLAHDKYCAVKRIWAVCAGRGRLGRLTEWISYALGALTYCLVSRGVTLNVFLTQPPLFYLVGVLLRALRRQPFVVIVMDVYPDVLFAAKYLDSTTVIARLLRGLGYWALRRADGVVVIGRCMQSRLARIAGVPPNRMCLIPNWGSDHILGLRFKSMQREPELPIRRAFTVLYAGNMGVGHHFDSLLSVAGRLPDVNFVFVGDGVRRPYVEEITHNRRLDNVFMFPFQPESRFAAVLAMGDLHVITMRDEFEGIMVPSKAYSSMCAGRPLLFIGACGGEIAKMIEEEKIGAVVASADIDGLEYVIRQRMENPQISQGDGDRARRCCMDRYGRAAGCRRYDQFFRKVASRNGS